MNVANSLLQMKSIHYCVHKNMLFEIQRHCCGDLISCEDKIALKRVGDVQNFMQKFFGCFVNVTCLFLTRKCKLIAVQTSIVPQAQRSA